MAYSRTQPKPWDKHFLGNCTGAFHRFPGCRCLQDLHNTRGLCGQKMCSAAAKTIPRKSTLPLSWRSDCLRATANTSTATLNWLKLNKVSDSQKDLTNFRNPRVISFSVVTSILHLVPSSYFCSELMTCFYLFNSEWLTGLQKPFLNIFILSWVWF